MVNEISNGLSNGKRSEATESDVGVRVEVGMCEAESGGMHVTRIYRGYSFSSSPFLLK